jgi:hypothetical protein
VTEFLRRWIRALVVVVVAAAVVAPAEEVPTCATTA